MGIQKRRAGKGKETGKERRGVGRSCVDGLGNDIDEDRGIQRSVDTLVSNQAHQRHRSAREARFSRPAWLIQLARGRANSLGPPLPPPPSELE